jgi:hypothetical protein
MNRMRATPLLTRRRRSRLAIAAILVLALWLFEFATHIHQPEEHGRGHHAAHACAYCAGLQPAAPATFLLHVPRPAVAWIAPDVPVSGAPSFPTRAYLSRAPPVS